MERKQKTIITITVIVAAAAIVGAVFLVINSPSPTSLFGPLADLTGIKDQSAELERAKVDTVSMQIEVSPTEYSYQADFGLPEDFKSSDLKFISSIDGIPDELITETESVTAGRDNSTSIDKDYSFPDTKIITLVPNLISNGKFVTTPVDSLDISVTVASELKLLYSNLEGFKEKEGAGGVKTYTLHKDNFYTSVLYLKFAETDKNLEIDRQVNIQEGENVSFTDTITNRGESTVENVSVSGFLPRASSLEIDAPGEIIQGTTGENWQLYRIDLGDAIEPGAQAEITYQASINYESEYSLPRAEVLASEQVVAVSGSSLLGAVTTPPAELESLPAISQKLSASCSPNGCGSCGDAGSCNQHSPNCQWQDGQCLSSCGNLGRLAGVTAQSLDDPEGNKKCSLQDLGNAYDADLCCDGPLNEYNCLSADDWGNSPRAAQLLREYNYNDCQPDIPLDDFAFIDEHACWLKMQAGWAIFDYVNYAGVSHYTELTADQYTLAMQRFVNPNMFYKDEESNEDCLCGMKDWCFGSPRYIDCDNPFGDDYDVSYAWWDDWGCGYPEQARHIWARGTCTDCPMIYCGDCDDYAILRAGLLRAAGFNSNCTWVVGNNGHAFNAFKYDDAYRIFEYQLYPLLTNPIDTDEAFNDHNCGFLSSHENPPCSAQSKVWNYPVFEYYDPVPHCTDPWDNVQSFSIDSCGGAY